MKNKTVLITGAAKRIGKEIALTLANEGYNIAIHYNSSRELAEKTANEIQKLGVQCKTFSCNLGNEKATSEFIAQVYEEMPDLWGLINNASIYEWYTIKETSLETLNSHININLRAPFILIRDFSNICKNGHIINIIDTKTVCYNYYYSAYLLSKKALRELTYIAAKELAPNIRVNGISPGLVMAPENRDEVYMEKRSKEIPMQKRGSAKDVAGAVSFLLESDFITGDIIFTDGGEHLSI